MKTRNHDSQMNDVGLIGTAWHGKHVVLLRCSPAYTLISGQSSASAPLEPFHSNCAETLSRLISIGYKIEAIIPLLNGDIQYVLITNS